MAKIGQNSRIAPSILVASVLFITVLGCSDNNSLCKKEWPPKSIPERSDGKVTIEQGIWGDVWFWEGDFMPICGSGTITPVSREIRIHELTNLDDVIRAPEDPTFYAEINTALVVTTWSDRDGFFEVVLPPGKYSVFVVEDTLFYANRFDGVGNIFPVEVYDGQATGIQFDITYKAYF